MSKVGFWLLTVLGFLAILGDATGIRVIKGLAAGTCASPLPKVFTSVKGLETFSTVFVLHYQSPEGKPMATPLDGELYQRIKGPYNRRNVFGAAMAYGPVLPEDLRDPVTRYALCDPAVLFKELGLIWDDQKPVWVSYHPREGSGNGLELILEGHCHE